MSTERKLDKGTIEKTLFIAQNQFANKNNSYYDFQHKLNNTEKLFNCYDAKLLKHKLDRWR